MVTGYQGLVAMKRSTGSHQVGKKEWEWNLQGGYIHSLPLFMHYNLETKYEHTLSDLIILCGDETGNVSCGN